MLRRKDLIDIKELKKDPEKEAIMGTSFPWIFTIPVIERHSGIMTQ